MAAYLASKGVFFTPTLATYYILMRPPFDKWITGDPMAKKGTVMQSGLHSLEVAEKVGLTICFGSDLMASMQLFQHNEFSIRARVQSNLSILRSASAEPKSQQYIMAVLSTMAEVHQMKAAESSLTLEEVNARPIGSTWMTADLAGSLTSVLIRPSAWNTNPDGLQIQKRL